MEETKGNQGTDQMLLQQQESSTQLSTNPRTPGFAPHHNQLTRFNSGDDQPATGGSSKPSSKPASTNNVFQNLDSGSDRTINASNGNLPQIHSDNKHQFQMCRTGNAQALSQMQFIQNLAIEGVDKQGRTSLRPIHQNMKGRPSILNSGLDSVGSQIGSGIHTGTVVSGKNARTSQLTGNNLKFVRKSDLSQGFLDSKSIISIKGEKEYDFKFSKNPSSAGAKSHNLNFSNTVPPQTEKIFELSASGKASDLMNMTLKENLKNSQSQNPMTTPNDKHNGHHDEGANDPFRMSQASMVKGSYQNGIGDGNLMSYGGSSSRYSQNLSSLLWQVPYAERKSILAQQQKAIDQELEADDEDEAFAPAEDTDLNEDDLDDDFTRKMSIRALNINTLHRFSPGSIVDPHDTRIDQFSGDLPPLPKKSMLSRASNLIVLKHNAAVERHSKLRASRLQKPGSPVFKPGSPVNKAENDAPAQKLLAKQSSMMSRDSDANFSLDDGLDEETTLGVVGMSAHRCSMIKRYNIETFFTPGKDVVPPRRMPMTETRPSGRQRNLIGVETHQNDVIPEQTIENTVGNIGTAEESMISEQSLARPVKMHSDIQEEMINDANQNQRQETLVMRNTDNHAVNQTPLDLSSNSDAALQRMVNRSSNTEDHLVEDAFQKCQDSSIVAGEADADITADEQGRVHSRHSQNLRDSLNQVQNRNTDEGIIEGTPVVSSSHGSSQFNEAELSERKAQNANAYANDTPTQIEEEGKQATEAPTSNNVLNQFVTKVPQYDENQAEDGGDDQAAGEGSGEVDLHRQHFEHTLSALQFISNNLTVVDEDYICDKFINLPEPWNPQHKKVLIFDMDETLIHCVDDIETQNPDVILEIDFPGEETVCAGINLRPYLMQCLQEANKKFQVIVFTASHQTYADAILDYVDPDNELFQYRLYRQHCVQTPEGYYVKDLRIIRNRPMKDMVIVDNSVYSFAYQIDNGIPIIPFYHEPSDEEMLHLIFYLDCLSTCEDVREQNREAFELYKLADQEQNQAQQDINENDQQQNQEQDYDQVYAHGKHSVVEECPTDEEDDDNNTRENNSDLQS